MFKNRIFQFIVYFAGVLVFCISGLMVFYESPRALKVPGLFVLFSGFLLVGFFILLTFFLQKRKSSMDKTVFFILLILLTVIPRLLWVLLVNTVPTSDFGHLHDYGVNASQGHFTSYVEFYKLFPFKFSYGLILAALYKIFGVHVLAVKILNILLSVCLALLIYSTGKRVFGEASGRTAGILFALWPAQIMFCSVLASEHVFIVFFVLGIWMFTGFYDRINGTKGYGLMFITGAVLALAQLVRPISTLLFPVFVLYLFFFVQFKEGIKQEILKRCAVLIAGILGFAICLFAVSLPIQKMTGIPVWKSSSGVNLLIGTNSESLGMFNKEDFSIIEKYNYDYDKVHKEAARTAIERIKSNPVQFIKLACRKFIIQWTDEGYGFYWSTLETGADSIGKRITDSRRVFYAISQSYYFFILAFVMVGLLLIRRNNLYKTTVFLLIFEGIAAAYTFLEVQSRYHFPVVPFFILFAAYGMNQINRHYFQKTLREV